MTEASVTTLGKYQLQKELGRGGFATVYLAKHATLHTDAAVKVLHTGMAADDRTRQRFVREAQTASTLDHPHIVHILDLEEDQGQVFIAMEYLPGGDLKRWMTDHSPVEFKEQLRILGEIADALDYANGQGLVHRDVKPSNILLDENGGAHLSDFGLVRPPDAPHLTQIGSVVGTATYISPEQAESRPEIDGRSDQYSLAIVAYELFVHQAPFSGENSTAVAIMHVTKPPPAPSSLNPEVPVEVDAVLLRALAKQPADRYPTCADFIKALRSAWDASDMRRFRELMSETRALLAQGDYAQAHQCMLAARSLVGDRPDQRQALAELEAQRQQAETYEQGVKDWQAAGLKAQEVLDRFPEYPDPQGLFVTLDLRQPPRRLPSAREIARQVGLGLAIGLPVLGLVLYSAFRWIGNH